jgi:hypothetical protein
MKPLDHRQCFRQVFRIQRLLVRCIGLTDGVSNTKPQ